MRRLGWLGGLLLLLAVFAAGRLTAPEPPPEVRVEERVVYKDRIVEVQKLVHVQQEAKVVVRYRDRLVKPDGTTVEHEEERAVTDTTTAVSDLRATQRDTEVRQEVVTVVSPQYSQWRVGLLAGVDMQSPLRGALVGAQVERRALGGLSVGAWVLTTAPTPGMPSLGLGISYEF